MILTKEFATQKRVFDAIRTTVQALHPDNVFLEDGASSPFLFKSSDELVWVRAFYQPMDVSSVADIGREISKLRLLMPKNATIYFFYPVLDQDQMIQLRAVFKHVAFFEYGGLSENQQGREAVKVCKWVPVSELPRQGAIEVRSPVAVAGKPSRFLDYARLSKDEIAELNDMGLGLRPF